MVYHALRAESGVPVAMAAVALAGLAMGPCLRPNVYLATELWAGTLNTLSVTAYALGWRGLGVIAGLLALFLRELTLPYCLICLALACRQRRRGEAWAWAVGMMLFGVYMAYHAVEVARHQTGDDIAHDGGWVRFGGTAFVLTTVGFHILLAELPQWTWAIYLPLSILGLAGWRGEMGTRVALTAAVYVAAFAVVGMPFNNYWGLIHGPLLALGFVRSPDSLRDLLRSVGTPDAPITPSDSVVARFCSCMPGSIWRPGSSTGAGRSSGPWRTHGSSRERGT
jgi:hypothetical protein